jgi:hypothetical protein
MRVAIFVLMLCSTTALASQCVQWADSITRQWTSIFLPDKEMTGCSAAKPEDEETYLKEFFGAVPPDPVRPKLEQPVPRKFQRGSNPVLETEGRTPTDNVYGPTKNLEDRLLRLSDYRRERLSWMDFQDLEEMLQGNGFQGFKESSPSSSSSTVVPTETVTVIEHQPTKAAREKITISIEL